MIATVDKFAALPWTGHVGAFFGRVERSDKDGFYGPCDPLRGNKLPVPRLLPPDLIIQDELHLISGPLGTMVGLYESALDELRVLGNGSKPVRPKIVASTATVRRADTQIRALFNRNVVDIFPPPGPDRRDSFFAETLPSTERNARLWNYLEAVEEIDQLRYERKKAAVREALDGFSDEEVYAEIGSRKLGGTKTDKSVKIAELETLIAAKDEIGEDRPDGVFYARNLPRKVWDQPWMEPIQRVVLVHRLREVVAQVGRTCGRMNEWETDGG